MGFKLGKARQPYMTNGKIKSTLSFNKQAGDPNASSIPNNLRGWWLAEL